MEIERLLTGDPAAAAAGVEAALMADGHIVLHGDGLGVVGAALCGWGTFAALPLAVRERYRRTGADGSGHGGWMLMREEAVYTSHMAADEIDTEDPKQEFGSPVDVTATRWPADDEVLGFAADVASMAALLDRIARRLMGACERILGEAPGFLRHEPGYFALKQYPGKPGGAAAQASGLDAHTDAVVFTMISQDRPALQIQGRDGAWVTTPADPARSLTVIPGDWMELFTNGRIPAVRHRVLDTDQPRLSLAFFQNVDRMPVRPLARFVGPDSPAQYPEVMSDIDYIGGASGVPRWQSHVAQMGQAQLHPTA